MVNARGGDVRLSRAPTAHRASRAGCLHCVESSVMADVAYLLLTLAFFAALVLLAGALDRRLSR